MKISDLKTNKGIMCPSCRSMDFETEGTLAEGSLTCKNCNQSYVIKHETLSFIDKNLMPNVFDAFELFKHGLIGR